MLLFTNLSQNFVNLRSLMRSQLWWSQLQFTYVGHKITRTHMLLHVFINLSQDSVNLCAWMHSQLWWSQLQFNIRRSQNHPYPYAPFFTNLNWHSVCVLNSKNTHLWWSEVTKFPIPICSYLPISVKTLWICAHECAHSCGGVSYNLTYVGCKITRTHMLLFYPDILFVHWILRTHTCGGMRSQNHPCPDAWWTHSHSFSPSLLRRCWRIISCLHTSNMCGLQNTLYTRPLGGYHQLSATTSWVGA